MKNRSFLSILEQLCMILIFAIAAALCLRGFSFANDISRDRDLLDHAVVSAQNAAEVIKSTKGDLLSVSNTLCGSINEGSLTVFYDENGFPTNDGSTSAYKLTVTPINSAHPLTGSASIIITQNTDVIFDLTVIWQRGEANE